MLPPLADGVAAGMALRFDKNDRCAGFAGGDGGRQAGRARSDDDDVGRIIPMGRHNYISSTSRSVLQPQQQIMTLSLAACSSSLSTASRWSGMPEMTRVTHSPQMPSSQE